MKKLMCLLFSLLLIVCGCMGPGPSHPPASSPALAASPAPNGDTGGDTAILKALLPDKLGYVWQCFGTAECVQTQQVMNGNALQAAMKYKMWLPKLGKKYTFFGLAEYGHKGRLTQKQNAEKGAVYEYRGYYADGKGTAEIFVIRYYVDKERGTVTEKVISNQRGKAEVNSRLHNLVLLKFPLKVNAHWSQKAKLNGQSVTVRATITALDDKKGLVKVKYTATSAKGYYNNTYIEERTFEKGYGMTAFANLMPGRIGISKADSKDPKKLRDAIVQHMFGYTMNKTLP